MKHVEIFTDGSSRGNPGPGGYGTILRFNGHTKELSQGYTCTTNNRMELLAAIVGLESLKQHCKVTLYSDSKYLVDAINQNWITGWKAKGWSRGKGKPLKNVDLWKRLYPLLAQHTITWQWVKGHAGHAENERCDELATTAADDKSKHVDDTGFKSDEDDLLL